MRSTLKTLLITLLSLSVSACAAEDPELTFPSAGGEASRSDSLPLAGVSVTPSAQGGSETGLEGGRASQGGESAPQGGQVSSPGGQVAPQGGEVSPQGGEVSPQGGEQEPSGGSAEAGTQGGAPSSSFDTDAPCEGLRDETSVDQRCGRFIGCVYSVCPERQLSEEALRPLCLDTLEPEDTATFCAFSCDELVELSGACEEPPAPPAEFCGALQDPSDPAQACEAMSACLLSQCPEVEPTLPSLCEEWAGEICAQVATCEELSGALCP